MQYCYLRSRYKTGIQSFISPYHVREVQVTLLSLYCENLVPLFVDLNDEKGRIQLVNNNLVDKKVIVRVLWNVLVKLLLLVLFHCIIHKCLHPLRKHNQVLVYHSVRNSLLIVYLKYFESVIMSYSNHVSIFRLIYNPISVTFSLVNTHFSLCFYVPDFCRSIFRITDQKPCFFVEHHTRNIVFMSR